MLNDRNHLQSVIVLCRSDKKGLLSTIDDVLDQKNVQVDLLIGSNGGWDDMQEEQIINHINASRTERLYRTYIKNERHPINPEKFLQNLMEKCMSNSPVVLASGDKLKGRNWLVRHPAYLSPRTAEAEIRREDEVLEVLLSRRKRLGKVLRHLYAFVKRVSTVELMIMSLSVNITAGYILITMPNNCWVAHDVFYVSGAALMLQIVTNLFRIGKLLIKKLRKVLS